MRQPALRVFEGELVMDNFAGGGGASTGIEWAIGRSPDIAINHDAEAIAMHKTNHPNTKHFIEDVYDVDIVKACAGKPVGLAWYSPDCTFHSKARGGRPFRDRNRARRRRGLAWIVIKHAKLLKEAGTPIRIIAMENVQEFAQWGPLDADGKPCPLRKGFTFRRWCAQLQNLGYELDMWELKGCDYGAPTTRERLFIVARCDQYPIAKPRPTHGNGLQPYRTAAECIDWSIPCQSIFDRKKPLADNTLRRIAEGIRRFVVNNQKPFIVPVNHSDASGSRVHDVDDPLRTITASRRGDFALCEPFIARIGQTGSRGPNVKEMDKPLTTVTTKAEHLLVTPYLVGAGGPARAGEPKSVEIPIGTILQKNDRALVAPTLIQVGYGEREGQAPRVPGLDKPLGTVVGGGRKHAVVAAFLAKQNGVEEKMNAGQDLEVPMHTIVARDQKALVSAFMLKYKGTSRHGQAMDEPLHTVQAKGTHYAEVRAFLIKFYSQGGQWGAINEPMGTVTTKDRIGLVTIEGEDYVIADIGLRMLTPRELFRAQGFTEDYEIEQTADGEPLTKTAQVRMCGNSVCPPVAAAIVKAQVEVMERGEAVA